MPHADLYRRVRIQETVFELLSQQYEMARIEEAKDTPVVSIIDPPLIAEKRVVSSRALSSFRFAHLVRGCELPPGSSCFSDRCRELIDPADPLQACSRGK